MLAEYGRRNGLLDTRLSELEKWRGSPCRSAQTVDDLEETLDTLREEHSATLAALDDSRGKEQAQAIELAQLRERLAATEKLSVNFFSVRR
ncbi:hypothetical protein RZE46_004919 [Escherichia coli]|nr:hypothetical protein [Escherichia coli]EGO9606670.1 hypothetical protein [Escherichia coli]EJL0154143.1 hypothetical protein [Escherichia coli]ELO2848595.1 hypothetical protein [Escherichia coli]